MANETMGYVKSKSTGDVYPYVDKDENGFGIIISDAVNWFQNNGWVEVEENKEVIQGVGKDAETVVNELGGKQSKVLYRFDLLDPQAMFKMTKVLKEGFDKYGGNENWRNISVNEHLNHLLIHAYAYLAGDKSDEHLSHIMCRAMFAQAVDIEG